MNSLPDNTFFLIRFPHEQTIYCSGFRDNAGNPCDRRFVIKGFDRTSPFIFSPCTFILDSKCEISERDFTEMIQIACRNEHAAECPQFYELTISPADHRARVAECVEMLSTEKSAGFHKVVLARTEILALSHNKLYLLLTDLLDNRPDAAIFFFSTPETGTWIGASPELLLRADNEKIYSMALAGTRIAEHTDAPWDEKNIREQYIVARVISETFSKCGYSPMIDGYNTLKAGNVEHICSNIEALRNNNDSITEILKIAENLSPTPALSGYPYDMAMRFITCHEPMARELYGGIIGMVYESENAMRLYVNLRSGRYNPLTSRFKAYIGGGITSCSDPSEEVEETKRKLRWLDTIL